MDETIEIRRAATPAEYRACQDAQRRAWGVVDEGYILPVATMVGAQLHGGLALGAFLADGTAVGLSFGFLGRVDGHWCLYSQLTGVVPGYQGRGLGLKLKQVQWEFARSQGLDLLAWAFDPLQAGNAHFNLVKLGATARRYYVDLYGPRTDALNAGVRTDRLIAEWSTRKPHSPVVEVGPKTPRLLRQAGDRVVDDSAKWSKSPRLLVEIPEDIGQIRAKNPGLAAAWADAACEVFRRAFDTGYRAVGFVREAHPGGRRTSYVLERP